MDGAWCNHVKCMVQSFGQMRDERKREESVQTVDLRLACRLAAGENSGRSALKREEEGKRLYLPALSSSEQSKLKGTIKGGSTKEYFESWIIDTIRFKILDAVNLHFCLKG